MSSTPITYRGKEFTADDGIMAVWLHFVIKEMDKLPHISAWLKETRDEWNVQSTVDLGYVDPGLDQVISTEEQRDLIVSLYDAAMRKLRLYGDYIEADELNAMNTGGEGSFFTERLPTKFFITHGDFFIRLLKNELGPDETDARLDMFRRVEEEIEQGKLIRVGKGGIRPSR